MVDASPAPHPCTSLQYYVFQALLTTVSPSAYVDGTISNSTAIKTRTSRESKQHTAPRSPTPPSATTSITDVLFVAFASHGRLAAPTFYVPGNGTQLSRRPANIWRRVRRPTCQQSKQQCRDIAEQGEYCQNGCPLCATTAALPRNSVADALVQW